jgi:hypothetical protein
MKEIINNLEREIAEKERFFEKFLAEKNIAPNDERLPLIKEVWDKALEVANDYVGLVENVDLCLKENLGVKEK